MLDEIQAGIFDGWTYEQIEEQMPQEYAARKQDKLKYRYWALFNQLTISLLLSCRKPVQSLLCFSAGVSTTLLLFLTVRLSWRLQIPKWRELPGCDSATGACHH